MQCRRDLAVTILSVRRSVKRVHCDKTEDRSVRIFTVLHAMQTRYSDEKAVLSVRLPSNACTVKSKMLSYRRETALQGVL